MRLIWKKPKRGLSRIRIEVCGTVIDKLISKGLLKKELSKNDRRSYRVKIVPAAIEMVNEISLLAEGINELALHGISETERKMFSQCLSKIIMNLEGEKDVADQ